MSGHSKWATIKHKKGKTDAKRGQLFTKISKEISVVAREGGGDPAANARLRLLLEKAKAANMPNDNVTRAIKKGTGEIEGAHYEAATYEGYGPHGVAVMVETLSDNKNRTASELRHLFSKAGGSLAENGAVAWMFERLGVISALDQDISEDSVIEALMDYDIDNVVYHDGTVTVTCNPSALDAVKKACQAVGLKVEAADISWVAKNHVALESKEDEEKVYKLLEALDELDDVQNVYASLG
jgi:YebC/PmpR family DNA-binding regulatory protein